MAKNPTDVDHDDMVQVIVDTREPNSVLGDVAAHPLVHNCEQEALPWGDLRIGDVAIERKTPRDLASSIVDNRLFEQTRGLAEAEFSTAVVLLEGEFTEVSNLRYSTLPPTAIRGAVASVLIRAGVPTIACGDREGLIDLAVRLGQQSEREHETAFGQRQFDHDPSLPPTLAIYAAIPGIGHTRAEALYERYPSVADIVTASAADLQEIDGVGQKTAETIIATLQEGTE